MSYVQMHLALERDVADALKAEYDRRVALDPNAIGRGLSRIVEELVREYLPLIKARVATVEMPRELSEGGEKGGID